MGKNAKVQYDQMNENLCKTIYNVVMVWMMSVQCELWTIDQNSTAEHAYTWKTDIVLTQIYKYRFSFRLAQKKDIILCSLFPIYYPNYLAV